MQGDVVITRVACGDLLPAVSRAVTLIVYVVAQVSPLMV